MQARIDRVLAVGGTRTVLQFHRELGHLMWDKVGMARNDAGLREALARIRVLREEYWQDVRVPGRKDNLNKNLELALRVADYLEFAELVTLDALHRTESCGCHFRDESETPDGEARDPDPSDLDRWCALHEAIEKLPVEEREAFGLAFYHGWTQPQIAELFGVDERTIRRRWRAACRALHNALGGDLPQS